MTPPRDGSLGARLVPLATLLLLVFVTVLACLPGPGSQSWIPGCPFHELTGLYCPGCGSTRALHLLVDGRITGALRSNALLIPALGFVLTALAGEIAHPGGGPLRAGGRVSRVAGIVFLVAVVVFTVLRNIPLEPFRCLTPG